jgi:hypothetical protein
MDTSRLELARTELDFLQRLLLDVQRRLAQGTGESACTQAAADPGDPELVAALELALALLRWDGETPPELDAQVGLGAAVQMKLGGDGMCAYRQWRSERRRRLSSLPAAS